MSSSLFLMATSSGEAVMHEGQQRRINFQPLYLHRGVHKGSINPERGLKKKKKKRLGADSRRPVGRCGELSKLCVAQLVTFSEPTPSCIVRRERDAERSPEKFMLVICWCDKG